MALTIDGGGNFIPTGTVVRTGGAFVMTTESGSIIPGDSLQITFAQAQSGASHLSVAGSSEVTLALTCSITPLSTTSVIQVTFYSMMAYGGTANSDGLRLSLYRSIGGGAYTNIVPVTGSYPPGPWYGWTYFTNTWSPLHCVYFDSPNTTSAVTYQLRYRNGASSTSYTNYLVHNNGHYYGWILEEIGN
jgi:hypothetical protein